ncbi:zinc finger, PHD-type containing protein [Tanacetum coccineum]
MQHLVDSRAWKNFDTKYPDFVKEQKNVRLGLAADGFNPFGNLSQSYIMWPMILTTYNLPPWLCMKESSFMLTLLIPGPKSPSKTLMSGQGYKACPTCNKDTPSTRVLGKTAYVGYRRFLKKPYIWKRSLDFSGEIKDEDPPRKFDRDDIMDQLARFPTRVKGKHLMYGGMKIKHNVLVKLNWTKRSIFYELEYWSFLTLKHNLDVMHIKKNMLESILNTLLMNDKSKDTIKERQDLKRLGIRSGLWLNQNKNRKCTKPQVAYSFTPRDRKKFCQLIKGVKLPDGFGSNFKHKVTDYDTNITGLKSHDCHIMMQRLLPYGLQQYLPIDVAKPIIELCLFFKQICSQTLIEDDMLKAQSKVVNIVCNLELTYPPGFFDIMIHLVIHLPLEALEGGPIRPRWMYPFERYMKKLKNYVLKKLSQKMLADVARGHKGDGGGDDRPPTHESAGGYRGSGKNLWIIARAYHKPNREHPARSGGEVLGKILAQFDLQPHMQSELWPDIRKGIDQHLGKIYTDNKSSLKRDYWVKNPDDELSDMQSSATQEYPSLIQTFFDTHTVGGVFLWDKDRRLYEEMLRLHGLGTYTDDQIMAMVRRGKQRGHIPGVGRVLAGRSQHENESGSGSGAGRDDESSDDEDADEDEEDADS